MTTRDISYPVLAVTHTAEVGAALVESATLSEFRGIRTSTPGKCLNFLGMGGAIIESGDTLQEYEFMDSIAYCGTGRMQGPYGIAENFFCLMESEKGVFQYDARDCEGTNWVKGKYTAVKASNFQRTLYYNGKSGNEVYFDYREFKNDLARPAFTQNLTFDLAEDNVIGFRGMRMQVLEATNTSIKYRLLANFSD